MTTATTTFTVFAYVRSNVLSLSTVNLKGERRTLTLNTSKIGSIEMSGDEQSIFYAVEDAAKEGKGDDVELPMTIGEMKHLVSVRDKIAASNDAPAKPAAVIVPEPAVVLTPNPAPVAPIVNGTPSSVPLTSLANHTVTVTVPEGNGEKKKRQRKTDPVIRTLYEAIARKTRRYGVDDLEAKINSLAAVKDWADGSVRSVNYEIPTVVRAEIIAPSDVLRSIGLIWRGGSHWIGKPAMIQSETFQQFKELLNRYAEGTPNAARLGAFAEMTDEGVSFNDLEELKDAVSKSLSRTLIKAHTDLITGLDDADKALATALNAGEMSSDAQIKERAKRDNAYRAAIREAHEALNAALTAAQNYDHDENVIDLLKGLRAVTASRRSAFNAQQQMADLKGIEV